MSFNIPSLDDLVVQLSQLPGIGRKTAQRLAIYILKSESSYSDRLVNAIVDVKSNIRLCKQCFNISEQEVCKICSDQGRDRSKICVVEFVVTVSMLEEGLTNVYVYAGEPPLISTVIFPLCALHVEFSVKTSTTKNEPGFTKSVLKFSLHKEASVTSTEKFPPGNPEKDTV